MLPKQVNELWALDKHDLTLASAHSTFYGVNRLRRENKGRDNVDPLNWDLQSTFVNIWSVKCLLCLMKDCPCSCRFLRRAADSLVFYDAGAQHQLPKPAMSVEDNVLSNFSLTLKDLYLADIRHPEQE